MSRAAEVTFFLEKLNLLYSWFVNTKKAMVQLDLLLVFTVRSVVFNLLLYSFIRSALYSRVYEPQSHDVVYVEFRGT
jgi:hypothetical protein